jgi:hypothetical protein
MGAAQVPSDIFQMYQSNDLALLDPGSNGTIDLRGRSGGVLSITSGTRKLPNNTPKGVKCYVYASTSGTLTNVSGTTVATLGAGHIAECVATSSTTWVANVKAVGAVNASDSSSIPYTYGGAGAATMTDVQDVNNGLDALFTKVGNVFIPVPLYSLRIMSSMAVGTLVITDATPDTGGAGLIGSTTTPILAPINGATTGCQRLQWAASNNTVVGFQVPLPPTLDDARDITLSARIASGGTTDAVGFTLASYFGETGAAVADTTGTNQTTTYSTVTATIAAADVVAASTLTVSLTPVAHTADTLNLTALWLTVPITVMGL